MIRPRDAREGARSGPPAGLLAASAWQLAIGSLPLLAVSATAERDGAVNWNTEFVVIVLFLALAGTSVTTAVWYWLVQRLEVGRLTLFIFLVPILGLGIAAWAFGERVTLLEGTGMGLTVAGLAVAGWESWQSGREEDGRHPTVRIPAGP